MANIENIDREERRHKRKRKMRKIACEEEKVFNYMTGEYEKVKPVVDPKSEFEEISIEEHSLEWIKDELEEEPPPPSIIRRRIKCRQCSFVGESRQMLKIHEYEEHQASSIMLRYKCKRCAFISYDYEVAMEHKGGRHVVEKVVGFKIDTDKDSEKPNNKEKTSKSVPKKQSTVQPDYSQNKYLVCGKSTVNLNSPQNQRQYSCFHCKYTTVNKALLSNHIVIHKRWNDSDVFEHFSCPDHEKNDFDQDKCDGCFYAYHFNKS
ncbi:uncharacterized protein LOC115877988 [Sitophilus oryzae]|uniref:Uncharacterized protein LOC115877988 n=1 Tax=Sitophilus oryzae TaxID=7048 RepID=A0A6J2XHL7_SITOR|nr:uncharacterized protein LOC115877988 [Sitophilus oryzae]